MTDIKLFTIKDGVNELPSSSVNLEKELQNIIEQNMETFFGVTFLRSEYSITNGRIDSLGIDENFCPVIFEYKRNTNENVINQGLFYLDWLLDHKADYKLLVMDVLGKDTADKIDWSVPCVYCIANDFTRYDEHAVNQMQRNIKLVRYKKYNNDLLLFEQLNAPTVKPITDLVVAGGGKQGNEKTFQQQYENAPQKIRDLCMSLKDYITSLGDDISENQLKLYVAFRKVKNFASIEVYASKILLNLKLNPDSIELVDNYIRDIRNIGHWGTGDLQVIIRNAEELNGAKYLIDRAYAEN